jgi:hypothetical protein
MSAFGSRGEDGPYWSGDGITLWLGDGRSCPAGSGRRDRDGPAVRRDVAAVGPVAGRLACDRGATGHEHVVLRLDADVSRAVRGVRQLAAVAGCGVGEAQRSGGARVRHTRLTVPRALSGLRATLPNMRCRRPAAIFTERGQQVRSMSVFGSRRAPRLDLGHRFALVDVETTGLNAQSDRIVQVAVRQVDRFGATENVWHSLVKPGCGVSPLLWTRD